MLEWGVTFCFFSNGGLHFVSPYRVELLNLWLLGPTDLWTFLYIRGNISFIAFMTPLPEWMHFPQFSNFLGLFALVVSINKLHVLLIFHNTATIIENKKKNRGFASRKKEVAPSCRRILLMLATHLKNSFILYSTLEFYKYGRNPKSLITSFQKHYRQFSSWRFSRSLSSPLRSSPGDLFYCWEFEL